MEAHSFFYYPYASFTSGQLTLLKAAALYFDKLILLDPVGASWATVGADHVALEAITRLKDAGGLGLVSSSVIPGSEWLLDWRDGKKTVQENSLHYLLRV